MAALTKADLSDMLFNDLGLNKREAKEMVELFFEEIRSSLENNEEVRPSYLMKDNSGLILDFIMPNGF